VWIPLRDLDRATRKFDGGDLSPSAPEAGPPALRRIARTCNDLSADFQEVLLLFAHLSRSAATAAEFIRARKSSTDPHALSGIDAVLDDIGQMQEMVMDFKYFRVRVGDDGITDTGVRSDLERGDVSSAPAAATKATFEDAALGVGMRTSSMPPTTAGSGELS